MGMFSALFRSRDKPQNRTAGSSYAFYLGGSTSGKAVTERSAMQMTAGTYSEKPMPLTTEQAVIMLSSHFYESRDGSTGRFFANNVQASEQVWNTVNPPGQQHLLFISDWVE